MPFIALGSRSRADLAWNGMLGYLIGADMQQALDSVYAASAIPLPRAYVQQEQGRPSLEWYAWLPDWADTQQALDSVWFSVGRSQIICQMWCGNSEK